MNIKSTDKLADLYWSTPATVGYHWVIIILIGTLPLSGGINTFASVFTQQTPKFACQPNLVSSESIPMHETQTCEGEIIYQPNHCLKFDVNQDLVACQPDEFVYDLQHQTVVTYLNLICQNKIYNTIITIGYFFGFLLGAITGGYLSDTYGRKFAVTVGSIGLFVVQFLIPYVTNSWQIYCILRILSGICVNIRRRRKLPDGFFN